jgi:hypothetical protein
LPLKASERSDRPGFFRITGTVHFPDGTKQSVRQAAQSRSKKLAKEEAVALEAEKLRTAWHGERKASRSFAEAVLSYLEAAPRSKAIGAQLQKISMALGDVPISAVTQDALLGEKGIKKTLLRPDPSPATVARHIIVPVRVVLNHAADQGWCDAPRMKTPKQPEGRVVYLLPSEANRLVMAAAFEAAHHIPSLHRLAAERGARTRLARCRPRRRPFDLLAESD